MKLVLVNYEYQPLGGGAGNATACIARALALQGQEVTVVTSAFGDLRGTTQEAPNLTVARLAARRRRADRSNYGEMLSFVAAAARFLPRFLRAHAPDGMIVFFSLPCGPLGWLAHHLTGTPYVISLRGSDVPETEASVSTMHRLLTPVRRMVLRNARAVIANSRGLSRLSEAADPIPTAMIPNGVDTEVFAPAEVRAPNKAMQLLYVGRLQSQKNLIATLEQFAFARSHAAEPMRLMLAGDGPQRAELEMKAQTLGLGDAVQWLGWLDKPALLRAYHEADVMLNPSFGEGMPNTVLEAMACALPVIASRVTGNDELVKHGETGLLFDLADPGALGRAILQLANEPARRLAMGVRAREIVCADYSWGSTAAQYAALFQRNR